MSEIDLWPNTPNTPSARGSECTALERYPRRSTRVRVTSNAASIGAGGFWHLSAWTTDQGEVPLLFVAVTRSGDVLRRTPRQAGVQLVRILFDNPRRELDVFNATLCLMLFILGYVMAALDFAAQQARSTAGWGVVEIYLRTVVSDRELGGRSDDELRRLFHHVQ